MLSLLISPIRAPVRGIQDGLLRRERAVGGDFRLVRQVRDQGRVRLHSAQDKRAHQAAQRGILHCWWHCKLVQTLWKSVWQFLRKLDMVLLEDPAIPLLGIYPEDIPTSKKETCSTIFIAALFIIARRWKEPRCPSTEEWIQKNVVHLHNGVLPSYQKQ